MGSKWRWGVIIDAGSSGSRLHIYRWKDAARVRKDATTDVMHGLPKIKTKWTKKIRPGVSAFGEKPTEIGKAHLQALVDYALEIVPDDMVADTPIFLMATAGMRFLPQLQQTALLREMCSYLSQKSPFLLPDCAQNIQVIPGETEGLYGWLAANYLLGGLDHPDEHQHGQGHHTYGFLDMGGASAQIAFAPNTTEAAEHTDSLKLVRLRTMDGRPAEHRVFTATWLGFGVNKARESYVQTLTEGHRDALTVGGDIPDPCMPKGIRTTLNGQVVAGKGGAKKGVPTLLGTGDFTSCLVGTRPVLASDSACGEGTEPCLIHDPVPSIDFNVNHFLGVSEYYHSTHGFFGEKGGDIAYDFTTYQRRVNEFCDRPWVSIADDIADAASRAGKDAAHVDRKMQDAQDACFKASWVINVLHEGIGIPRVGLDKLPGGNASQDTAFRPVDTIDGVEVSWTLGRMLLYASGQVPPYDATSGGTNGRDLLPVGFGSNTRDGSTPTDFTYAGSTWTTSPTKTGSGKHHDDDDDDLLDGNGASSGLLIFLLLLFLVAAYYVLRKREWRMRLSALARRTLRWPGSGPRRSPGRFGGSAGGGGRRRSLVSLAKRMLFRSRLSHDYERVLEEGGGGSGSVGGGIGGGDGSGNGLFELGDMDDDGSMLVSGDTSDALHGASSLSSSASSSSAAAAAGAGAGSSVRLARAASTPQFHAEVFGEGGGGAGSGAVGRAIDRSGFVVRTESRERLGGPTNLQMLNAGRRSRAASPTRLKSPLAPPVLEE